MSKCQATYSLLGFSSLSLVKHFMLPLPIKYGSHEKAEVMLKVTLIVHKPPTDFRYDFSVEMWHCIKYGVFIHDFSVHVWHCIKYSLFNCPSILKASEVGFKWVSVSTFQNSYSWGFTLWMSCLMALSSRCLISAFNSSSKFE